MPLPNSSEAEIREKKPFVYDTIAQTAKQVKKEALKRETSQSMCYVLIVVNPFEEAERV